VGFLGSYAALMLFSAAHRHRVVVGAVIATVASDVGGYVVGSQIGSRSLAPDISPNKSVEGWSAASSRRSSFTTLSWASCPASIRGRSARRSGWTGRRCRRTHRRSLPVDDSSVTLGIKDMSSILPGHGGVLDRFDGLLFALPATYYLARLLFS